MDGCIYESDCGRMAEWVGRREVGGWCVDNLWMDV